MAITTVEKVKAILGVTNKDTLITELIPMVEAQYVEIRNKPFDVVDGVTQYPASSELTAIRMVGHLLKNIAKSNIQSESLGDYSVSYIAEVSGYPESLVASIVKYIS